MASEDLGDASGAGPEDLRRPAGATVRGANVRFTLGTIRTRASVSRTMILRIDRNASGARAIRAFVSAKCMPRQAAVLNARVAALGPGGQPAVTG